MNRFAVMVDAGYVLRQAVEILSSKASTKRNELVIHDPAALVGALIEAGKNALGITDRELLRVYWYDGVPANGFTPQQRTLSDLPDFQLRAGTINSARQQKGVDSLIITDLIELAANHAICDAVLYTGDSDLAVGIELAQRKGVRIAVIGVEDLSAGVPHHQSHEILSRADRVARIGASTLSQFLRYQASASPAPAPTPVVPPPPAPVPAKISAPEAAPTVPPPVPQRALDSPRVEALVQEFVRGQAVLTNAVDPETKRIQPDVDRALVHYVYAHLALGKLTTLERNYAREVFRRLLGGAGEG